MSIIEMAKLMDKNTALTERVLELERQVDELGDSFGADVTALIDSAVKTALTVERARVKPLVEAVREALAMNDEAHRTSLRRAFAKYEEGANL
jgi:hypothetical protein